MLSQDLDGSGTGNDVTLGFDYNLASQIVTRSLSNEAYEFPITNSVKSYTANGRNQYTQVGGTTHTWDANGNLTSDSATTFSYDTENRLVSASGQDRHARVRPVAQAREETLARGGSETRSLVSVRQNQAAARKSPICASSARLNAARAVQRSI